MLEDFLARLAVASGVYQPTIEFLTGAVSALAAAVLLYLHFQVLPAERWIKYLGWAYVLFFFRYSIPASVSVLQTLGVAQDLRGPTQALAQALGSPVTNLCLLAAAMALLGLRVPRSWEKDSRRTRWPLPGWVIGIAVLTALLEFSYLGKSLYRLPEALLSGVCLVMLGSGMWQNSGPKRHPLLAGVNLVTGILYAQIHLLYALNPALIERGLWPSFEKNLQAAIHSVGRTYELAANLRSLDCIDALVFAVAFLLKISLFLGALLLIIRRLQLWSPESGRGLLDRITWRRGRYLAAEGVLRVLGESVEADLAELCVRMTDSKAEEVARWRWLRTPSPGQKSLEVNSLPSPEESIVAWVMKGGIDEVFCPDRGKDSMLNHRYQEFVPGMRSFVAVPVRYHGAVIACFNVEWKERRGYSATTIERMHQFAELLAPALHARRQLIALDTLAAAFHTSRARVESGAVGQYIPGLIQAVHDTLSPLATAFLLSCGFRRMWVGCNDQGPVVYTVDQDERKNARQYLRSLTSARRDERLVPRRERLYSSGVEIGAFDLMLAPGRDPDARPSLADDYLHRRTVASMLAEAVLESIHEDLRAILNELQVNLSRSVSVKVERWFEFVAEAARKAGLLWTVAKAPSEQSSSFIGDSETIALVRALPGNTGLATQGEPPIAPIPLPAPVGTTHTVLALSLRTKDCRLWFGLGRAEFDRELAFDSPWKVFLQGLAQAADSAIARIEKQLLELQAQRVERVATRVETAGLLMHTLGNDAAALINGTERLTEMLTGGENRVSKEVRERVAGLKKSALNFKQMTVAFRRQVPDDDRTSIPLMEAIELVKALYGETLMIKQIEFLIDVDPVLPVRVPINVAYIALVTLVVNSVQAIRRDGRIEIGAVEESDLVRCTVRDTGPGINEGLVKRLFEPGFSTKSDGTGLGLSLARNALRRCEGDLQITSWQAGNAIFTILFPR